MKNKHLWLIPFILLLLFPVLPSTVNVKADDPAVLSINKQGYVPSRIVISYSYTNNFSISDVSSMGQSLYKIISGPTSIEFKAEDTDQYTFTIRLEYAVKVSQSIQIAMFSSTHAPESLVFNVKSDVVEIDCTLTTTKEPSYPDANDVAEQVVLQVSSQLMDFKTQMNVIINDQNANLTSQWLLIGVLVVIAIITSIFAYSAHSKIKKEEY